MKASLLRSLVALVAGLMAMVRAQDADNAITGLRPNDNPVRIAHPGAVAPPEGAITSPVPTNGLIGYWNFEKKDGSDSSGNKHDGVVHGGAEFVEGIHGRAIKLRLNPSMDRLESWDSVTLPPAPALNLTGAITLSAWFNYADVAQFWGSQIIWFGDSQFGRDPWTLQILPDRRLQFRSDRSVTGKPKFTVFEDEVQIKSDGKEWLNQHVSVISPGTLRPETWYFVAGTIEKTDTSESTLRLYLNADQIGEVKTSEIVDYPTDTMWMTIGAVDKGTWQNFVGVIDEVRVYNRALTPAEIKALYHQPWKKR